MRHCIVLGHTSELQLCRCCHAAQEIDVHVLSTCNVCFCVQVQSSVAQGRADHGSKSAPPTAKPTAFSSNVLALSSSGSDDSALNAVLQLVLSCPLLVDALLSPDFVLPKGPTQQTSAAGEAAGLASPAATVTATGTTTAAPSTNVSTGKGPVGYALQHAARQIHGGSLWASFTCIHEALFFEPC